MSTKAEPLLTDFYTFFDGVCKGCDFMSRRAIYECVACCDLHCTIRTYGDKPPKCVYWQDKQCWVRKDKHKQKELREYAD